MRSRKLSIKCDTTHSPGLENESRNFCDKTSGSTLTEKNGSGTSSCRSNMKLRFNCLNIFPEVVLGCIVTALLLNTSQSSGLVIPHSNETTSASSSPFPYQTVGPFYHTNVSSSPATLLHPRRLTRLPKSTRNINSRPSSRYPIPAESAKSRARLLLGSLNRQNCFAKVLCGLGARPPTTKTDLVNDYVYLMEELMVDDDDDDEGGNKKSSGKSSSKKNKKNKDGKPVFKNDNSDSSQSDEDNADSPLGFMAEGELAAEDPQVLKYVRLEQKRRKYKDSAPKTSTGSLASLFSKRQGKDDTGNNNVTNDEDVPLSSNTSDDAKTTDLRSNKTRRDSKLRRARQLVRQVKHAVKTGKTLGGSRQCRTIFNQCPFDDVQMNEIVTNLRKMMQGKTTPATESSPTKAASTPVNVNSITPSATSTVYTQGQNGGGAGSKVEIVLHLNQNGLPYNAGLQYGQQPYGMPRYPVGSGGLMNVGAPYPVSPGAISAAGAPVEGTPSPLVPAAPLLIPTSPVASLPPSPTVVVQSENISATPIITPVPAPVQSDGISTPPSTTTTTVPTTVTTEAVTERSVGEEQLLDFLYGAVNFNESDPVGIQPHADIPPNPFWSSLAASIPDPFADDFEHQLKVRNKQSKKKFPSWNADDDDDDDSKSSEEMELKKYLVSLRETLQGLAQMNNATLAVETKVVKQDTSEEDDSVGDPLDDDLPLPGIAEIPDESEEEEEDEPSSKDKEVKLKTKGKKKKPNKSTQNKGSSTSKKQKKKPKPISPSPDTNILIAGVTSTLNPPKNKPSSTKASSKKPSRPNHSGESSEILFDDDEEENDDLSSSNYNPNQQIGSNFGNQGSNGPHNNNQRRPPPQDDDEFEPEESGENNSSGGNNNAQDDEGDPSFEEPSNEESEETSKKPKKRGPTKPPKITLKFDPEEPMKEDPDEMTPKEKRKLMALTNALLPTEPPVRPVSPEKRKPPVDVLEEIRIPTVKPVANEFQAVANIVKSTEVINIDEFAEDSGKDPTFPKKSNKNKKKRRNRIRYQNRRRPAPTRPLFQRDGANLKPVDGRSSEEDFSGPSRAESLESNPGGGPLIARPFHGTQGENYGNGGPQQFDIFGSVMNIMGLKPVDNPHFRADPNDAMEKHPLIYHGSPLEDPQANFPPPPSHQPPHNFHRQEQSRRPSKNEPVDDRAKMSLDDLPTPGEDYKFTIKPADPKISINIPLDDNIYKQPQDIDAHSNNHQSAYPPPPPGSNRPPHSGPPGSQNDDNDDDEYSDEEPYDYVQPSSGENNSKDRPELDLPPTAGALDHGGKKGDDGILDDEKKEEHDDGKKKKKGKGKKKKDDKKKDDKKKDHDKKKKKHHKGWGHEHGYSQQFHQQVFPPPEKKDHGIWAKIKNELGAIASGFGDTENDGWVSFIDLGFKDNKEEGNPGHPPIGPHVNTYGHPPPHHHPIHHDGDDDSRSDEEEDDVAPPDVKDVPQNDGEEDDDDDDDGSSEGEDEDDDEDANSEDEDKGKKKEGNNESNSETSQGGSEGSEASQQGTTGTTTAPGSTSGGGASSEGSAVGPVQAPAAAQQQDTPGASPPKTVAADEEEAESGEKTSSTTTTKSPIAPKPPKYKVKRNRNKVRGKKKKKPQATKGPPITLFVTTTEKPPQTTAVPTEPPRSKPPKRRILYKPPAAKVHSPPGTPLNIPTTAKPIPPPKSTKNKQGNGHSHPEDDEVEPPSVFFQPGPNGQNIRGKPPIPIDVFHIQSEDMLDEPDLRRRSALHFRTEGSDEGESGEEEEEEGLEDENNSSGGGGGNGDNEGRRVMQYKTSSGGSVAGPISIEALYKASEDSEEMRGGGKKKNKKNSNNYRRHRPPHEGPSGPFGNPYGGPQQQQNAPITSAVMNSAIFSDHFKHLYTKVHSFGQSFMTPKRGRPPHPHMSQPYR